MASGCMPNKVPGKVSVIDTATNAIVREIPVLPSRESACTVSGLSITRLFGMVASPDSRLVYIVTYTNPNTISVIDTTTKTVVDSFPAPKDSEVIAIHPDGKRLYVTTGASSQTPPLGSVNLISLPDKTITTIPV